MQLRIAGLALALLVAAPAIGSAQYFGKNKVQWTSFKFEIIQTEHFDVYFYEQEREAAMDAARMAERSYARLSRIMNHNFKDRKPIILYASHSDFQQTNALSGDINEATGGVTDFLKHRAIMPFTGSYAEFEHVLTHEMVHQFQYDIWSDGKPGAGLATLIAINPPLWFVEGMAEYLSLGEIGPETAMWLRDAAGEGTLPSIQALTFDPYIFPYRFGHALMAYIGERWGDEAVGALAVVISETQQSRGIVLIRKKLDTAKPIVVGASLGPDYRGSANGNFKHRHIGLILRDDSVTFCGEQIEG